MKALVLAAGYATRLYPLTESIAKPLLTIGERPMVDHILERIREADPLEIHVVTNSKFAGAFSEWAPADVTVHDDGTTSGDDRLGAIGDLRLVLERAGIDDDWLVVAGDNLFDYSLGDYVRWWRTKGVASAVALYEHPELELVKQYGVVGLDEHERVVSFIEKPPDPVSNLAATACYIFHREHLKLVATYLDEGNVPDQPGRFVEWLHRRAPVYGYRFAGEWLDIGDRAQLLEADNRARTRAGLSPRDTYAV
jgi:glucose-1-phosphate thymidylyltransferase